MQRRAFLQHVGSAALAATAGASRGRAAAAAPTVQTVRGPVAPEALGPTLPHEHILVDFIGAGEVSPARYAADDVAAAALPHLRAAQAQGVRTLVECTPDFLARDPRLLARLSAESGLHLVTNTGLYGARRNIFLPPYAHTEPAERLAARWIAEARDGIDGTGIRPGFIKSGVDPEPVLSDVQRKLVAAAALTHAATGLTIAVHTGRGPGLAQLDVLRAHGVAPAAYIWVHAQGAKDDDLFDAADRGAWISCDGLNRSSIARHLHLCVELRKRGHLGRVLLSHDAGWFDPAKPGGGAFRGYDLLFAEFVPLLRRNDFSAAEIERLTVRNPADVLTVRMRPVN